MTTMRIKPICCLVNNWLAKFEQNTIVFIVLFINDSYAPAIQLDIMLVMLYTSSILGVSVGS